MRAYLCEHLKRLSVNTRNMLPTGVFILREKWRGKPNDISAMLIFFSF